MTMRVRFAEPRPPGHTVFEHVLLPRLGLPLMATVPADLGHDAAVFCDMLAPIDLDECLTADLVGISATTATQPAGYALADQLSAAGVEVVLGGPHVTFCAEEALEHARFVARGEGQKTIVELVDALECGLPFGLIAGLSWRDQDGAVHHNPARERCTQSEFERLPIPDLSLIRGHERMRVKPIMTQWGSPFDCDFCSVTAQFSRVVRYRRTDQILEELAGLSADEVFFYDDNFVVNKRRTRELLLAMIGAGLTPQFSAQMRADTVLRSRSRGGIDHQFLKLLRQAGRQTAMIGFESVSDENLALIGKRSTVEDSVKAVRAFHDHGIGVHGMFIAGLDGDDASSAQATVEFARRLDIDTMQLMMITPAPGTRLFDRLASENRLIETDWALFDGHHAVLRPHGMTPLELQLTTLDALRQFYSRNAIASSAIRGMVRELPALLGIATHGAAAAASALGRKLWAATVLHDSDPPNATPSQPLARIAPSLTSEVRDHLQAALWVAALRLYGRRQIAMQRTQERTIDHVTHLATLS